MLFDGNTVEQAIYIKQGLDGGLSVRKAVASTKAVSRPPPKGFPGKFLVRFDVEATKTEPVIQASAR